MATTIHTISSRLSTLSDSNKTTLQLIQRLAKLSAGSNQASSSPSASFYADGTEDVYAELTSDITESLRTQTDQFELLRQELDWFKSSSAEWTRRQDQERDREWTRLSVQAAKLQEDLQHGRSAFRRAQLQAKRNAELAVQRENRQRLARLQEDSNTPISPNGDEQPQHQSASGHRDLFQRSRPGGPHRPTGNPEVDASADVTAALRQTHALMETELSRSRFAQETLDQTSKALEELTESYSGLDTLLSSSRSLLGSLLRSQKSDTWYLETAFWVLVSTIIWLLFRRLLYGPLWWLVWLPGKLVLRVVFTILGLSNAKEVAASEPLTSSRPPLIVQPSASNAAPPRAKDNQGRGIRVGMGGAGAKKEEPLSEQVGQMAEGSRQGGQQGKDASKRGDGQELKESDEPRNPKKRMFEEPSVGGGQKKDEL